MKKIGKLGSGTILFLLLYGFIAYFAILKHNILDIIYVVFLTFYFLRIYFHTKKKDHPTS